MDENGFPTKFLIDGVDRLGKSSLVQKIQQELGYLLTIHYDKPKLLKAYLDDQRMIKEASPDETDYDESYRRLEGNNLALRLYQESANISMFQLLSSDAPIIFDRSHLGEMVYAPLYRGYDGNYVFDMEKEFLNALPKERLNSIKLILLTTSNFDIIVDDGLSFNPQNKGREQDLFVQAFEKSAIPNKVIVNVHDGFGSYKSYEDILNEVLKEKIS